MTKFVITIVAAALVQPALSVAGVAAVSGAKPKPSSFVPHPHTSHHVYGAPLQPVIGGRGRTSHHKQATKKRSSPGRVGAPGPAPQ
jgi:hypothetical protein